MRWLLSGWKESSSGFSFVFYVYQGAFITAKFRMLLVPITFPVLRCG
jgi:hypothetical protein